MPIFPTTILAQSSFSGTTTLAATPTFYAATVGSSYTATLAATSGIAEGTIIHISIVSHTASQTLTIARNGSDVIRHCGASLTSIVLDKPNAELILRKRSTGWDVAYVKGRQTQSIWLTTPGTTTAGYGTSDLMIRRYTVTREEVGTAISKADAASTGTVCTINEAGDYAIRVTDGRDADTATNIGVSINIAVGNAALDTNVDSLASASRLFASAAFYIMSTGGVFPLKVGDLIRPHMGAGTPNTTNAMADFHIWKEGD